MKILSVVLFLSGLFYLALGYYKQDASTNVHIFEALVLLLASIALFFYKKP